MSSVPLFAYRSVHALAAAVLLVASLLLLGPQPGPLGWAVVVGLGALLGFALLRLHLRLAAAEGERDTAVLRITFFWVAALMLTVWLPAEEARAWRIFLGGFFAAIALLGTWNAMLRERDALHEQAPAAAQDHDRGEGASGRD